MRIKNLYIRDFGIFSNQRLEELGSGVVVIGGYNRAGKTTLLQILRHLGYGFPRGEIFPPARGKYDVEGELFLEEGSSCNLRISGLAEPVVSYSQKGNQQLWSHREIYNQLDLLTYHQIYTISLDELQRLPKNFPGREGEKLQSILLGAGLGDLVLIPQLEKNYLKEAEKIGGKNGTPGVKEFKPYNAAIREGLILRKEALHQVEEYREKQTRFDEINLEITTGEEELRSLQCQVTRLDVLKNNFADCHDKGRLEILINNSGISTREMEIWDGLPSGSLERARDLSPRMLNASKEYNRCFERFRDAVVGDNINELKERYLTHKEEFTTLFQKLSGLQEKLRNYQMNEEDCYRQEAEIVGTMDQLNSKWRGDLRKVLEISIDSLQQDQLTQQIEQYKELFTKRRVLEAKVQDLKSEEIGLIEVLRDKGEDGSENNLLRYFGVSVLFVFGGIGLSLINVWAGLLLGIAGIVGIGLVQFYKYSTESSLQVERRGLKNQLISIRSQIEDRERELQKTCHQANFVENSLQKYRQDLEIDTPISPELLKDYYRQIQDLKRDIVRMQRLEEKMELDYRELSQQLERIAKLMGLLWGDNLQSPVRELLSSSDELFAFLERGIQDLNLALDLERSEIVLNDIVNEVKELVDHREDEDIVDNLDRFIKTGESYAKYQELCVKVEVLQSQIMQSLKPDRVRDAMALMGVEVNDTQQLFAAFEEYYTRFTSVEDVIKHYEEAEKSINILEEKLKNWRDERQSLRDEIDRLATTENLEKAQHQIDQGRARLRPLAERYAVNNAAAFLLAQIRKGFIEKTKDTLLSQASGIFREVTGGAYQQIMPPEELMQTDFQTITAKGLVQETAEILSRGTREQLFLAVRISRIKEIQPPLPVILDDTLVNFDSQHISRTIDLLLELARSHQIFILTCHSQLVKYIVQRSRDSQYWQLEDGRFSLVQGEELVDYLSYTI